MVILIPCTRTESKKLFPGMLYNIFFGFNQGSSQNEIRNFAQAVGKIEKNSLISTCRNSPSLGSVMCLFRSHLQYRRNLRKPKCCPSGNHLTFYQFGFREKTAEGGFSGSEGLVIQSVIIIKNRRMEKKVFNSITRRRFLGTAAAGVAGIALLPGLGSCKPKVTESKDLRLGFIGLGRQAMHLLRGFIQIPGVRVVAGSDVYGIKCRRFVKRVTAHYAEKGEQVEIETYEKYQDLLAREDIDAVIVATPDHYHAIIAIAAVKAGKDVYLEKPLTFTILEGQELRKAVRENNRILAVGSQQRSDPNFQHEIGRAHV